jgi:hypothetical protein
MEISMSKLVSITLIVAILASTIVIDTRISSSQTSSSSSPSQNVYPPTYVSVTNWPTASNETVVWLNQLVAGNTIQTALLSGIYDSNGFAYLHIVMQATERTFVISISLNAAVNSQYTTLSIGPLTYLSALTETLNPGTSSISVSVPVPAENFFFSAYAPGPSAAPVTLAFYLSNYS